ncbi:MAG: FkbM family methyltransferase [Dokdonella sp.]
MRPAKRAYRSSVDRLHRLVVPAVLQLFNFNGSAVVDSHRFRIPIHRGIGIDLRSASEPWMSDLLRRLFRMGAARGLIDVGVNVGQTLLKLKSIDPDLHYFGFEPNPSCVSLVQELIRLNGFRHCELAPVALSDRPGLLQFIAGSESDSGGSMMTDLRPDKATMRKQFIATLCFDDLQLDLGPAGIVKIDVEGAELFVLRGMERFLHSTRPYVICEVLHAHSPAQLNALAERNVQVAELCKKAGYEIFRVKKAHGRVDGVEPVMAFPDLVWDSTSSALCDYLFVPAEHCAEAVAEFANSGSLRYVSRS